MPPPSPHDLTGPAGPTGPASTAPASTAPPGEPHLGDARTGDTSPVDALVHERRWRTLGVLCLSLTIVMVANMSLNLALPAMARDLDASTGSLQWMVDAYALVFAGLLFSAGTLGDRFGRKGALLLVMVILLCWY